jgi:hypothetical protein
VGRRSPEELVKFVATLKKNQAINKQKVEMFDKIFPLLDEKLVEELLKKYEDNRLEEWKSLVKNVSEKKSD